MIFIDGLLSAAERKTGWMLADQAGNDGTDTLTGVELLGLSDQ